MILVSDAFNGNPWLLNNMKIENIRQARKNKLLSTDIIILWYV